MAIPIAYRDTLLKQFVLSFVDFIAKKRKVAELEAKVQAGGTLTVDEANILSHFQRDITRDRAVFQIWKQGLQDHTKFKDPTTGNPFPAGGYNLQQIKTYILNNRVAVLDWLVSKYDEEMSHIDTLKTIETTTGKPLLDFLGVLQQGGTYEEAWETYQERLAEYQALLDGWQARLDELDARKAKRQAVKDFILELRNKPDNDFVIEAEM